MRKALGRATSTLVVGQNCVHFSIANNSFVQSPVARSQRKAKRYPPWLMTRIFCFLLVFSGKMCVSLLLRSGWSFKKLTLNYFQNLYKHLQIAQLDPMRVHFQRQAVSLHGNTRSFSAEREQQTKFPDIRIRTGPAESVCPSGQSLIYSMPQGLEHSRRKENLECLQVCSMLRKQRAKAQSTNQSVTFFLFSSNRHDKKGMNAC